jgi:hypothetical protein
LPKLKANFPILSTRRKGALSAHAVQILVTFV